MAVNFYRDLSTSDPSVGGAYTRSCFPPILEEARRELKADLSIADTSMALKGMGSLKAPGLDGYQLVFFKRTGSLKGQVLQNFAQGVLGGGDFSAKVAEALQVLIPEKDKPGSIKRFRPISLCNVSMKVVSKMFVKCLKKVLDNISSPNQATFLLGR